MLNTCYSHHEMSKRKGKFIGGYIPETVKEKLQKRAKELDRSLSWLIEKILSEGVEHPKRSTNQTTK